MTTNIAAERISVALENMKALESFARNNPQGFSVIQRKKTAERVMGRLFAQGMSARALLIRACLSPFMESLMALLAQRFREDGRWQEYLEGVVCAPFKVWEVRGGGLPISYFASEVLPYSDQLALFTTFRDELCSPEHPLFNSFSADEYWLAKVGRFIESGDFRRAWDELKKAKKGMLKHGISAKDDVDGLTFNMDPCNRCFQASNKCLASLVDRLFEAMVSKGEVQPLTDSDRHLKGTTRAVLVYSLKPQKPRQYTLRAQVASLHFALSFGAQGDAVGGYHLEETGAKVIKIADWLFEQKNAKRRQAYERLLAATGKA
ncbi:hypothetical protein KKF59_02100 [Patescibacteria group bacterium]|nr:hypothetical protein [Patescibacteria group bacterium]MBU1034284.1 hypothetical protein [Patescibacteria group bacterium]MBU1629682.1 hypothetical protein [Patescibacteria group bacterium]MBU1907902.1 hypothetical protein [Patescibacteria group bacterium]